MAMSDDVTPDATARDRLVVLLTVTTGAVDATSFIALGKVFGSVMTGNLVLLGVAAASHAGAQATHSGLALAGYAAGVLVGVPVAARKIRPGRGDRDDQARRWHRTWPVSVTVSLALELILLAAFTATWELTVGQLRGGIDLVLAILASAAMGVQAAAVRRLGQMSTTYLTSTFTGVLAGLATRTRPERLARSVGVLAAIVAGAVAGGLLVLHAPRWLPVVVVLPLAGVVAVALRRPGRG
jgi:uncharacterized membrane protein YoaK (UPF0700 family)